MVGDCMKTKLQERPLQEMRADIVSNFKWRMSISRSFGYLSTVDSEKPYPSKIDEWL